MRGRSVNMTRARTITLRVGQRFGKLVFLGKTLPAQKGVRRKKIAKFKCDCGKTCWKNIYNVRDGLTTSCGCIKPLSGDTAGGKETPLHKKWRHLLWDKSSSVEPSWRRYLSFKKWAIRHGYDESNGMVHFERINGTLPFGPGNVRIINHDPRCKMLTYNGETLNIKDWAKRLGMSKQALWARINVYGMSVERALSEPISRNSNQ